MEDEQLVRVYEIASVVIAIVVILVLWAVK